jgi:glucose-fructose oxidoreductase
MANTVADCDAMIAACRKAGVRLMVGYRLHYEPHTAEFCRLAREQTFGPFMKIAAENGFDMGPDANAQNTWRLNKKLAGGGPLMDMGVYVIQAVSMAKAEAAPVTVTAKFGPVTRPRMFSEVEQSIEWTADFADGAEGKCLATYAEQLSKIRAEAARGWAEIKYPAFYYDTPILVTSRGTPDFPVVNHQLAQMDGMALELLENRPSLAPGEMGRRDVAVIEAIYASANSGKRTEVRA